MTIPNGPLFDQGALNAEVYDLQRKFGGIEEWAAIVNDSITDHAKHPDNNNERLDAIRQGQAAMRTHHEQLGKDVLEVMTRVQNNDDELKARVASCIQLLGDEVEKFKGAQVEAQRDLVKLLDGKVREMESNIEKFKAAVSAGAPADSSAPLALRLGNVESNLATLVARADAADAAAAASVAAAAAAAARDQIVEATLRDLNARMGTASAGASSTAPAGGQNGTDPMAGGNDAWSRFTASQQGSNDQQRQPQQRPQEHDIGSPGQPRQPPQQPTTTTTTIGKRLVMDLKIAQLEKHQYDDARPESWHKKVRTYMMGRHIDLKPFPDWVESRGTKLISFEGLEGMGRVDCVMVDLDPIQCSTET